MNHVTREEALTLRAEHNAAQPTTTPWEAHVVTDEQGTDTRWRIDAPEAAVEALAELSNVGEGAQTDARYIARAVNLHARLFETVIAQADENARLSRDLADLRARFVGELRGFVDDAARYGADVRAARETAEALRAQSFVTTQDRDAAIAALWRCAKGARRLADQGKALEGAEGPVSVDALKVRAAAFEAAAELASFILRGGCSKPAPSPAEALALTAAPPECTGLSAGWCPNCGDCTCPDRAEAMDTEACPLHGPASRHAATLCASGCGQIVAEEGHRCPPCEVAHLRRELAAAHEIIAGRETPPTDREVEEHERVNGLSSAWLCVWEGRPRVIEHSNGVRYIRGTGGRPWWPLDSHGRPCAWPTVTT